MRVVQVLKAGMRVAILNQMASKTMLSKRLLLLFFNIPARWLQPLFSWHPWFGWLISPHCHHVFQV